jgi:hypothetical protein
MAGRNFNARLSLDGGADIKKQLQKIGASGKKAFADLERASQASAVIDKVGVSLKDLQAKARQARDKIEKAGAAFNDLKWRR